MNIGFITVNLSWTFDFIYWQRKLLISLQEFDTETTSWRNYKVLFRSDACSVIRYEE